MIEHRTALGLASAHLIAVMLAACSDDPDGSRTFDDAGSFAREDGSAAGGGDFAGGDAGPSTDAGDAGCGGNLRLTGVVRDFREFPKGGHPDFQRYMGFGQKRMVLPLLGPDFKPVYNPDPDEAAPGYAPASPPGKQKFITSPDSFAQWYRDVEGVNVPILYELVLTPGANGLSTFESSSFFPIDGRGFGNQDRPNNYSFTFELHTEFEYKAGDVFTFSGDDDLWTFINGKLVIDLGGLHEPQTATVDLDQRAAELGIAQGGTYTLDVFHAERHTDLSNFRIDTSIDFTNCAPIIR